MNCLKCGNKTTDGQVFCDDCLEIMQRYPVKPGTAIHLPQRTSHPQERKQHDRKKDLSEQDTVAGLHGLIRWLIVIIAILSIFLLLTASLLIHMLDKDSVEQTIGRNYTTTEFVEQP